MNSASIPTDSISTARPELLAPAGDWDCVRAAIENGADAVYFGLECGFNARLRAANFSRDDLPRLMATLHLRGVKGYATLNTLVFSGELAEFEEVVRDVARAGVDAVLVQDVGAARLVHAVCPDLPIHASTQMTLTSAECIELAQELGIERVVLARELSIPEIAKIRRQTTMPLEVFVHGALCVAYSGQCLTSESLGGRSANRGQCAQACRLPYDLICDGRDVDLGERKYLLSPQDLAAYALVPELLAAGVCSLKIEGRLKTPEYVANITHHYRRAIDEAVQGRAAAFTSREVEEMELSFSRGFSPGWLGGCDHKMLVPAESSAKRGVLVGRVIGVHRERATVELCGGIKRGDGVAFDRALSEDKEQGGRIYEIFERGRAVVAANSGRVEIAFAHGRIDWDEIRIGQALWKTEDPDLTARLKKTYTGSEPRRRMAIDLHVRAAVDAPLMVEIRCESGDVIVVESEERAAEASRHPVTVATLEAQLGRLGGTPFELRKLTAEIVGRPMMPFSVLGKVRHEMTRRMEAHLATTPVRTVAESSVLAYLRGQADAVPVSSSPTLHVLCREMEQLRHVFASGERNVYVDFADIRQYREAVQEARRVGATIHLATPRVQKPDEMGIFHAMAKYAADGILVRNYAGLTFFTRRGIPTIGDFSLNVTNETTAQFYRSRGLARLTTSYDLNRDQLLDLVAAAPAAWLEVTVHQHMPMFHMEHCVFCAVLSPGTNKTNCGRPCDTHEVKLRDRVGMEHPLTADVGCRNTLFNAVPQSAAELVPALIARGVSHFRVELLKETHAEINDILRLYRRLLAGDISGKQVWTELRAANRVGVTRGTLEERRNPLAIL